MVAAPKRLSENISNEGEGFKKSGGNSGGNKSLLRKKAYDFHRKPLNFLVAGAGFEPMTFGL
jgi:hypothetical protein